MPNFANLDKFNVKNTDTAEFELNIPSLDPKGIAPAILIVRPATDVNREYTSEVVKRNAQMAKNLARGGDVTEEMARKVAEHDRKLFPKYVITGWRGIYDANGRSVKFNPTHCAEFIAHLPDWMFNELRFFCSRITNFIKNDEVSADETGDDEYPGETLAGN